MMSQALSDALAAFYRIAPRMDFCLSFHYPENVDPSVYANDYFRDDYPHRQVIGLNTMDDPFFIDDREAAQGFPVYFTWHDGDWDNPIPVSPSLASFGEQLARLEALVEQDSDLAADHVARHFDIKNNALWQAVHQSLSEWKTVVAESERAEAERQAKVDSGEWVWGQIVITDVGAARTKVAARLAALCKLSPAEALAQAKQPEIVYRKGLRVHMQPHLDELHAWGVKAEFVPSPRLSAG